MSFIKEYEEERIIHLCEAVEEEEHGDADGASAWTTSNAANSNLIFPSRFWSSFSCLDLNSSTDGLNLERLIGIDLDD